MSFLYISQGNAQGKMQPNGALKGRAKQDYLLKPFQDGKKLTINIGLPTGRGKEYQLAVNCMEVPFTIQVYIKISRIHQELISCRMENVLSRKSTCYSSLSGTQNPALLTAGDLSKQQIYYQHLAIICQKLVGKTGVFCLF